MSFKNHFDMLGMNEPITHKAKFWQSYVRALKGTEDIRADEHAARLRLRPRAISEFPDFFTKSLLDDRLVSDPNTRIHAPGYRYLPISRETYGYSPRPIYPRPILTSTRGSSVPPEIPAWREGSPIPNYPRSHYSPVPWDRSRDTTPAPDSYSYDGVPMYGYRVFVLEVCADSRIKYHNSCISSKSSPTVPNETDLQNVSSDMQNTILTETELPNISSDTPNFPNETDLQIVPSGEQNENSSQNIDVPNNPKDSECATEQSSEDAYLANTRQRLKPFMEYLVIHEDTDYFAMACSQSRLITQIFPNNPTCQIEAGVYLRPGWTWN